MKDINKDSLKEYEKKLKIGTISIFNNFSLELIKLFQLLLRFGVYHISHSLQDDNEEFFSNLRNLIMILEFDKTYPESRAFLDKRKGKLSFCLKIAKIYIRKS